MLLGLEICADSSLPMRAAYRCPLSRGLHPFKPKVQSFQVIAPCCMNVGRVRQ
jgi:hypothetical protein